MNDQGNFQSKQEPVICLYWTDGLQMTAQELQVFFILTHFATLPGGAFPGVNAIAELANGKKKRAIETSLASLERKGFIQRTKRPGKTTVYTLARMPFQHKQSSAENCTTLDQQATQKTAPHQCKKLHPNNNEVIKKIQDQEQEQVKRTRKERKQLASLIDFSVTNSQCKLSDPQGMIKQKIYPFSNSGIDQIYLAGLKIGYRMTAAEVYKFAFIMVFGGYYSKRGVFHKVRNYDKLLNDWKAKQTADTARQAISEQGRLLAGEKVSSGNLGYFSDDWGEYCRLKPFPELEN